MAAVNRVSPEDIRQPERDNVAPCELLRSQLSPEASNASCTLFTISFQTSCGKFSAGSSLSMAFLAALVWLELASPFDELQDHRSIAGAAESVVKEPLS